MTAVALLARRPRPAARVLRLEIRRSPVPWVIPLIAALFFFDVYRTGAGYPPTWSGRASVINNHMVFDFAAFGAGLGAWTGSREGRRKTGDLLETTVRPAWARQAAALAGTLFWMVLAFLAGVAVIYVQTAVQATWGGPPLWPVAVGVAGVVCACVIGFTAGTAFPGRFTAPLAAVGVLVLSLVGFHAGLGVTLSNTYGLLSPATAAPPVDYGLFYRVPPDVAIAQVLFMGGITLAMCGAAALAPLVSLMRGTRQELRSAVGRTGRVLCAAGVALLAVGVGASWTAYALAGTARPGVAGWEIPALHDAASDQPTSYTPDCTGTSFTVCVHPAFGYLLGDVASAFAPVAAEIAGLPGAPAGAREVMSGLTGRSAANTIAGDPPVFTFSGDGVGTLIGAFLGDAADDTSPFWRSSFQQGLLDAFVIGQSPAAVAFAEAYPIADAAQQAVVTALLAAVGSTADYPQGNGPGGAPRRGVPRASRGGAAVRRAVAARRPPPPGWPPTCAERLRAVPTVTPAQLP